MIVFFAIFSALLMDGNNVTYLPGEWHFASENDLCLEVTRAIMVQRGKLRISLAATMSISLKLFLDVVIKRPLILIDCLKRHQFHARLPQSKQCRGL